MLHAFHVSDTYFFHLVQPYLADYRNWSVNLMRVDQEIGAFSLFNLLQEGKV